MALAPSIILDNHLYLSDYTFASDRVVVQRHNIDIILNVSRESAYPLPHDVEYLQFPMDDNDNAPIECFFGTSFFTLCF